MKRWLMIPVVALVIAACWTSGSTTTTAAAPSTTATTAAASSSTSSSSTSTTAADACAVANLKTVTPGKLTIATGEPAFPPWVENDDPASKKGFEAAVAYAVAETMGFKDSQVTWIRTGFDAAIAPGPKKFDFNIQQYSITPDRKKVVDFSIPYYTTTQALIALKGSPIASATTLTELKKFKLGAQIGTTSLEFIDQIIKPDTPAAVYDTNVDAKAGLEAKQIDALVTDLPTAYYITAVEIPDSIIVGQLASPDALSDQFGLLLAKDSPLTPCVDKALEKLKADGVLTKLADQWLTQGGAIKTIKP